MSSSVSRSPLPPSPPSGKRPGERRGRPAAAIALASALLLSCGPTETNALSKTGPVTGAFTSPDGLSGDAWLFLYRPGEGPPGPPAGPVTATAISALRLRTDPRYVFGHVPANPYRLWGFLDVDQDFDPSIDVLSQPTAGDRTGEGAELQVQPGRGASLDYRVGRGVEHEPPAFFLEGVSADVVLDELVGGTMPLTLVSDPLGRFDKARTVFPIGLVDGDGDGRPDDLDGDMVPDLSLQLFLRWLPLPGQLAPGATVIVPLAFDPSPILRTLNGQLGVEVTLTRLQAFVVPAAQQVTRDPDGRQQVTPFGMPPAGAYELDALTAGGQFWRLPNALGPEVASQAVRLHFDRVAR
ncbi:MAG: hypothetical protein AMXMBFR34_33370 [Myxococcaceae bacterium]